MVFAVSVVLLSVERVAELELISMSSFVDSLCWSILSR